MSTMKSRPEDDKLDEGKASNLVDCKSSSPVDGNDLDEEHDGGDSEQDTELVDLPQKLSGLASKTYDFLDELEADWEISGITDLPIVLDPQSKKARLNDARRAAMESLFGIESMTSRPTAMK
jgi:hypothetical protein